MILLSLGYDLLIQTQLSSD